MLFNWNIQFQKKSPLKKKSNFLFSTPTLQQFKLADIDAREWYTGSPLILVILGIVLFETRDQRDRERDIKERDRKKPERIPGNFENTVNIFLTTYKNLLKGYFYWQYT